MSQNEASTGGLAGLAAAPFPKPRLVSAITDSMRFAKSARAAYWAVVTEKGGAKTRVHPGVSGWQSRVPRRRIFVGWSSGKTMSILADCKNVAASRSSSEPLTNFTLVSFGPGSKIRLNSAVV